MTRKKFVGSNLLYPLSSNDKPIKDRKQIVEERMEEEIIDLGSHNLEQLMNNLMKFINKKTPMFLWVAVRHNKKILLDTEKLQLITNNISSLRALGQEFLELRADSVFSEEMLNNLVANRRLNFKQQFEYKIGYHHNVMYGLTIEREKQSLEMLNIKLQQAETNAKIEMLNARTMEVRSHANFVLQMIEELKKMSDTAKASMWHDYMGKFRNSSNDDKFEFELDDFYKQYRESMMNEDKKQKEAQTKKANAEADFEQWKTNRKMQSNL